MVQADMSVHLVDTVAASSSQQIEPVLASPASPVVTASYSKVVDSESLRNLRKSCSPSFLDDGTPTVSAPHSVLFQSNDVLKHHLLAHFHGSPPSPAKIFTDVNPIWGTHGPIAVRRYSDQTCLIYIPSEATRKWVLEVAFWEAGNCAFTVTKWSSSASLSPMKLDYAPIWMVLKNVPGPLYSLEGLSDVASGLREPLYTKRSKLTPNRFGIAKIKVIVKLNQKFPSAVRVRDKLGKSVTVQAEYPHIPKKCHGCNDFGHLPLRCPKSIVPMSDPITKQILDKPKSRSSNTSDCVAPVAPVVVSPIPLTFAATSRPVSTGSDPVGSSKYLNRATSLPSCSQ